MGGVPGRVAVVAGVVWAAGLTGPAPGRGTANGLPASPPAAVATPRAGALAPGGGDAASPASAAVFPGYFARRYTWETLDRRPRAARFPGSDRPPALPLGIVVLSGSSLQDLMCCVGHAVVGYPAQYVMEKCFAAAGLDCRYLTLDVAPQDLEDAVRGMQAMGFRGGHFTAPHKGPVVPYLPQLTDEARLAGLVNFVYRDPQGQYVGDNTDGKALCQCLEGVLKPAGHQVLILGAGEMARAMAVAVALAGAREIHIVNRSVPHGQQLADLINEQAQVAAMFFPWNGEYEVPAETDIVVNATSIESSDPGARVPVVVESLTPRMVVADVVFNPPRTHLLQEAAQRGCAVIDGLQLLVQQGVIAFKTWTGVDPDPHVMREALEEYFEL